MGPLEAETVLAAFFERVRAASRRVLMTDFDGTLAPFRAERDEVVPYPGVRERLARLVQHDRTRLVVVSGRSSASVAALLKLPVPLEIWGDHGWEHRLPSGQLIRESISQRAAEALSLVRRSSTAVFDDLLEIKPAGVAFHWRGLSSRTAELVREWAHELRDVSARGVLSLAEFDGGVELRVPGRTKADAVRAVLGEGQDDVAAAYLGDDLTDEDAFQAIRGRGLGVLVRPTPRESAAEVWRRPPGELLGFFDRWHVACGEGGR